MSPSLDAIAATPPVVDPGVDGQAPLAAAGADQVALRLGGLHCAACGGLIEQALLQVPGVATAFVQPAALRAVVSWRPAGRSMATLIEAVHRAGYLAAAEGAQDAIALRQRETRRALWQTFVALFCSMQIMMLATPAYVAEPGDLAPDLARLLALAQWVLALPVMAFAAGPFFSGAWHATRDGRLSMELPVALGIAVGFGASSVAAFDPAGALGDALYFDSVTMFIGLLLLARWLQLRATHRALSELERRVGAAPAIAHRLQRGGDCVEVAAHELRPGDRVRVMAGQAVPADGTIEEGRSALDESMLSGESRPVVRGVGDAVACGSLNLDAPLVVQVQRAGAQTRLADIVRLMQRAMSERPQALRTADRWAMPFTVAVLLGAALAAIAWGLIAGPAAGVRAAVAVLIVTCPCALALAVPTAQLAATGAAARRGLLLKRVDAWDRLATIDTVVLDKTGTLTDPQAIALQALAVAPDVRPEDRLRWLSMAASLAGLSRHPLSRQVATMATPASVAWTDAAEVAGAGIRAVDSDGHCWSLGSAVWCGLDVAAQQALHPDARLWLGCDGQHILRFDAPAETLRADVGDAVALWRRLGCDIRLLSGDAPARVEAIARTLGLTELRGGLSPADKLAAVRALQAQGRRVLMIGDGLNDAPVLAQADASLAFGEASDASRHAADAVLPGGRMVDAAWALAQARRTQRVLRQNLGWAAAYNLLAVPLALAGLLPPLAAGLGMAASSAFVALNALRLAGDGERSAGRPAQDSR